MQGKLRNSVAPERLEGPMDERELWLKRRREERGCVGWRIPRSAQAADWRKVIVMTLAFYIVVFVGVGILCSVTKFTNQSIPSRRGLDKGLAPLHEAFLFANIMGVWMPTLWILMVTVFPKTRVTLISEGVLRRSGGSQKLIPYSAIQKVCITPSLRRPSLNSFAILSTERGFPDWNHYEFGKDARVDEIIKAFEAKGIAVDTNPMPSPSPQDTQNSDWPTTP